MLDILKVGKLKILPAHKQSIVHIEWFIYLLKEHEQIEKRRSAKFKKFELF